MEPSEGDTDLHAQAVDGGFVPAPVVTRSETVRRARPHVAQAAAIAATAFAAGAAAVAAVHAARSSSALGPRRGPARPDRQVVARRRYVVDVYLLEARDRP